MIKETIHIKDLINDYDDIQYESMNYTDRLDTLNHTLRMKNMLADMNEDNSSKTLNEIKVLNEEIAKIARCIVDSPYMKYEEMFCKYCSATYCHRNEEEMNKCINVRKYVSMSD